MSAAPVDRLLRSISDDESVRVVTATSTRAVQDACARKNRRGVEAIVMGRALSAGFLLATLAKADRERLRIRIEGDGPAGAILVDARGDGRGRVCSMARVDSEDEAAKIVTVDGRPSVAGAVGRQGTLTVTRDLGLARAYQGSVELRSGEIDADLERYLDESEQLPSALTCATRLDSEGRVLSAAGILVQGFPGVDPQVIETVRARFAGGSLRALLARPRGHEELIGLALAGAPWRTMSESPLRFECPCGREHALRVLTTLGADDLDALAAEQPTTTVTCEFCGEAESLVADELRELATSLRAHHS